jgi:hypothetical protein
MPAKAGIQSVVDFIDFKNLDSRLRGNDGIFLITTQSPKGEGSKKFLNFYLVGVVLGLVLEIWNLSLVNP